MKYTKYLNDTNPRVSIDMGNYGVMELELFPSVAPITVENFLKLVEEKFYDDLIFHRVIKDFMI
jgi:peptidyl-prolyl cis-trans isomerase B (cyclophilin B)